MRKFTKIQFPTFKKLEKYFETKVLPKKNIRSKVIGKTIYVWRKPKEAV